MKQRQRAREDEEEEEEEEEDERDKVNRVVVVPVSDEKMSGETVDVAKLEAYLQRINFLDPSLGVREQQQKRDPMLTVLYDPDTPMAMHPGQTEPSTTVIDDLLYSAHRQFCEAYGSMYTDFELIQYMMRCLLASKNTHCKQFVFLCMLEIDEGLRDQFYACYPQDGGPEAARLDPFIKTIRQEMEGALNPAYHNVPRPSRYNVERLLRTFLLRCAEEYPG
jgi:hypothetical protein